MIQLYINSGLSTAINQPKAYLAQLCINRDHKPKSKHFWTTRRRRQERHINRDQQSESLYGTPVYQKRRISTAISQAKAYLSQQCISSDQELNRKHFWTTQPCRSESYDNRDQGSENLYDSAVYQQRGISTAISQPMAYLPQLPINSDHKPNRKHFWTTRRRRPERYHDQPSVNLDGTAVKQECRISTAISKAKSCLPHLCINSDQKQRRKHFWSKQSCRPKRGINRDQQSESLKAQLHINSAVYQPPSVRYINRAEQTKNIHGTTVYQQRS